MDDQSRNFVTRHLNTPDQAYEPARPGTGPLDYAMPWIIEFRIAGTPSVLQVEVRETMVVGRSDQVKESRPDIDLAPHGGYEMGVSRAHAMISARNSRISVRDMGSSNGTWLNEGRLEPGVEYRLHHGDTLTFGRLELQAFFVVTPSSHEKNETPFAEVVIPEIGNGHPLLIVDDDVKVSQALGSVLAQAGFDVHTARGVADGLATIDSVEPAIILTELMLPERSGLEIVHYIRDRLNLDSLPLIVISGVSGGYQMGQAIEAGADVFLSKPVGIDELLKGVIKVVPQIGTG